jgi:hypothetical protein
MDVPGKDRERRPVLGRGRAEAARRPVQLPELHTCPGRRLGLARRCVESLLHGRDRLVRPPEQLPRVRDAGVGREARLQLREPVEVRECLLITAELELRVAERAVGQCRGRRQRMRLPRKPQRLPEPVP